MPTTFVLILLGFATTAPAEETLLGPVDQLGVASPSEESIVIKSEELIPPPPTPAPSVAAADPQVPATPYPTQDGIRFDAAPLTYFEGVQPWQGPIDHPVELAWPSHGPAMQMQTPIDITNHDLPNAVPVDVVPVTAKTTLGEDAFLDPRFGSAALHIDVPYDADVTISCSPSSPGMSSYFRPVITREVRSRGGHRHLILSGISLQPRSRFRITAMLNRDNMEKYLPQKEKYVRLMAGDRKSVTFFESDFCAPIVKKQSVTRLFVVAAEKSENTTSAKVKKSGLAESVEPYLLDDETLDSDRKELTLFVKYGENRGVANCEFDGGAATPNAMLLTHTREKTSVLHYNSARKLSAKLSISLTRCDADDRKLDVPDETAEQKKLRLQSDSDLHAALKKETSKKITLEFNYDQNGPEKGTAQLDFKEKSALRKMLKQAIIATLNSEYGVICLKMDLLIEFDNNDKNKQQLAVSSKQNTIKLQIRPMVAAASPLKESGSVPLGGSSAGGVSTGAAPAADRTSTGGTPAASAPAGS